MRNRCGQINFLRASMMVYATSGIRWGAVSPWLLPPTKLLLIIAYIILNTIVHLVIMNNSKEDYCNSAIDVRSKNFDFLDM